MANQVNFFQPGTEAAVDASSLMRQREMARLLTQQGLQGQPGEMVSGHYVPPSKLSYLTQLASALGGRYLENQADEREKALAQQVQAQRASEAQAFMQASQGTPAMTREVAGPPAEGQGVPTQTTAAVPGDMNKALALALQSQNPMLQGLAPDIMKRQIDAAELQQALQGAGLGGIGGGGGNVAPIAGAPGAPVSAPSGLPPGVNPQAAALMLSRNAQANKLGTMFQEAAKPQVLTEGGAIGRYGPNGQWIPDYVAPKTEAGINVQGGQATPIPGFAQAQASREGQIAQARQAAESANTMVTVDINGKPTQMTRQQFLDLSGGNQPPPRQQAAPTAPQVRAGGVMPRGNFTGTAEQVMATIDAQNVSPAIKEEMRRAYAAQVSGNNPAYNDMGTGIPPEVTAGAGRGVQGGPGIVGQTSAEKEYSAARAKSYAEMAPKLQQAGVSASGDLRNLDALEQEFKNPNVAKGALAESISGFKNIGASFGIDMKGLGSEQFIQAVTNKMALAARSTAEGGGMPGALSDSDRKFLAGMQPGLNLTPEGRAKIIDIYRKVSQRQIDVANLAREYEMQHGQLDVGFDKQLADYSAKNQLFTQPTKGGGSKTNINDLLNKYR